MVVATRSRDTGLFPVSVVIESVSVSQEKHVTKLVCKRPRALIEVAELVRLRDYEPPDVNVRGAAAVDLKDILWEQVPRLATRVVATAATEGVGSLSP